MTTDTRHLDRALSIFRAPARPRAGGGQTEDYVRGLLALGWTRDVDDSRYFHSDSGARICITEGGLFRAAPNSGAFRPLPPKAVRNILLAGQ